MGVGGWPTRHKTFIVA